jgi:capsular polysaccharide biosynthesis protein
MLLPWWFPLAVVVQINSIDFASLSFREQLALIRKTDILVGAHGAALSHMMFLPSTSVVIEFWIDDRYARLSLPRSLHTIIVVVRVSVIVINAACSPSV